MLSNQLINHLEKAVLAPLFDNAIIKIQGSEAEKFLQSQLTNNVSLAQPQTAQLQSYCNVKGRAHCVLRLLRSSNEEDCFYLLLPRELADKIHGILKMYLLRAKAEIELHDLLQAYVLINNAELPESINSLTTYTVAGRYPRKLILANKAQSDNIKAASKYEDSIDYMRLHDIYSAIGQVYDASYDTYIPQFLNLDLTDGISFKKGCYPGQEIVARLRYLGKIKQRMIIGKVDHHIAVADKVYNDSGKAIGTVSNMISLDNDSTLLNMVINSDYLDSDHAIFVNENIPITRVDMPYNTPVEYEQKN